MDEETLLKLFKEQLENQSKQIAATHAVEVRGHWLIWWYFLQLEGLTPSEVEEVMCDKGGDLGIDAIWINLEDEVHIYSFKNPVEINKEFPATAIDSILAGLDLIFQKQHKSVACEDLQDRIEAIYQIVPTGYRLHLVTTGLKIGQEASAKLDAFVAKIPSPGGEFFKWEFEDLRTLQRRFYHQNLPTVSEQIAFDIETPPYMRRSGSASSYMFSAPGSLLADLYIKYGEQLLQRNIRADQGSTSANRAIRASCSNKGSDNFIHFNNGVTFLCDSAQWDPFNNRLTLSRSQIVNGGQTVRVLSKAKQEGSLRPDVLVAIRVLTSDGDRQFESDVTVNQNNQNQMKTGFLRSSDPCIVQLANSLASLGWYLERRAGELKSATLDEKRMIEHKIGQPLEGRVIRLKEGAQAYVATFYGHPEMAKKNPKKIFQAIDEGGQFELIFSPQMTAEKMIIASITLEIVEGFVKQFMVKKRRKSKSRDSGTWKDDYTALLGSRLVEDHEKILDQAIPQSAMFLCATIFQEWSDILGNNYCDLPAHLESNGMAVIQQHLRLIFDFAKKNPDTFEKSWPSMMKSNSFVEKVVSYMKGIHSRDP